jgi:hypothetical protein
MATIAEVREKYPQYKDLSDEQLATSLHKKFYSDMSFQSFSKHIGYSPATAADSNKSEGLPASLPRHQPTDTTGQWWKKELQSMAYPQTWGRQAKLTGRNMIDMAQALPMTAMDMGVSARNMLTGSDYQMPSQMSRESLSTALPENTTPQEKTVGVLEQMIGGSKLPAPQAAQLAPKGFVKPASDLVRQQTLLSSQKAGYVVPPSTTNPTMKNKIMESIGGKIGTAQDAAARNQEVTNTLAKRALGLSEDAPLTAESLGVLRREAGDAYATLRAVGAVELDDASVKAMDSVAAKFAGSKLKDAMGSGSDIPKIVQALKEEKLTGDAAVDAIDRLRELAGKAYASGDKGQGGAYRKLSETIENVMERNLSGEALKQFKQARQLIAKTYSVEGAYNPSTGNEIATKLAAQLSKGKPLSGDLLTAAKFGQAFPKAAREVADSGSVRNTDVIMGDGTSAISKEPSWLLYPFARQAMRNYLLSSRGQAGAVPAASKEISPEMAMALLQATASLRK